MRIAPRTMLCGIAFRLHEHVAGDRFDELREVCTAAGDKASPAIAMAGLVMDHLYQCRMREASQLASEAWELAESVGDATLIVGLSEPLVSAKMVSAEFSDGLRWSQRVIDLAEGDPSKGNFIIGSPLAFAFAERAIARMTLGLALVHRPTMRIAITDTSCWPRSAKCSCAGDFCCPSYRSPRCTCRVSRLGMEIAMRR
jgi:hypothetical protein